MGIHYLNFMFGEKGMGMKVGIASFMGRLRTVEVVVVVTH
jgi:hypothetical protein